MKFGHFYLDTTQISLEQMIYTPASNVTLLLLRSQNHFHSTEIDLGHKNLQFKWQSISIIQVRSVYNPGKNLLGKNEHKLN